MFHYFRYQNQWVSVIISTIINFRYTLPANLVQGVGQIWPVPSIPPTGKVERVVEAGQRWAGQCKYVYKVGDYSETTSKQTTHFLVPLSSMISWRVGGKLGPGTEFWTHTEFIDDVRQLVAQVKRSCWSAIALGNSQHWTSKSQSMVHSPGFTPILSRKLYVHV